VFKSTGNKVYQLVSIVGALYKIYKINSHFELATTKIDIFGVPCKMKLSANRSFVKQRIRISVICGSVAEWTVVSCVGYVTGTVQRDQQGV